MTKIKREYEPVFTPEDDKLLDEIWDNLDKNKPEPPDINSLPQPPAGKSETVSDLGNGEHNHDADEFDPLDELRAWETKINGAARKGKAVGKVRFVCNCLSDSVAAFVREGLQAATEREAIKSLFEQAALKLADEYATPEEYTAYWQQYDDLQKEIGHDWLRGYMAKVLESLDGQISGDLTDEQIVAALEAWQDELVEQWVGTEDTPGPVARLVLAGQAAGDAALTKQQTINPAAKFSLQIDWGLMAKQAFEFAKSYAYELIKGLTDTTRQAVRDAVSEWVKSGKPLDALRDNIRTIFNNPVRAEMIAQSESTRVYAEGAKQRWGEAGVNQALWKTVMDNDVCSICRDLRNVSGDFEKGWIRQQDGNAYYFPAHPRCRCFPRPIIE